MAALTLKTYNTVSLTSGTPQQLATPSPTGHYYLLVLNLGPGNLFIKGDGTVSTSDPASFELPINLAIQPLVTGGLWLAADQTGKASVMLVPR